MHNIAVSPQMKLAVIVTCVTVSCNSLLRIDSWEPIATAEAYLMTSVNYIICKQAYWGTTYVNFEQIHGAEIAVCSYFYLLTIIMLLSINAEFQTKIK